MSGVSWVQTTHSLITTRRAASAALLDSETAALRCGWKHSSVACCALEQECLLRVFWGLADENGLGHMYQIFCTASHVGCPVRAQLGGPGDAGAGGHEGVARPGTGGHPGQRASGQLRGQRAVARVPGRRSEIAETGRRLDSHVLHLLPAAHHRRQAVERCQGAHRPQNSLGSYREQARFFRRMAVLSSLCPVWRLDGCSWQERSPNSQSPADGPPRKFSCRLVLSPGLRRTKTWSTSRRHTW